MKLDPLFLSRLQFAFVVTFHIIFPAFTIGLASWLATMEGAIKAPEQARAAAQSATRRPLPERATAMARIAHDAYSGTYFEHLLARTYVLVGEPDKAIDALTQILKVPYWVTSAELRIDPSFAPLRNNPRFQALVATN